MKNYSASHLTKIVQKKVWSPTEDKHVLVVMLYFGTKAMSYCTESTFSPVMASENYEFTVPYTPVGSVAPQLRLHIRKLLYGSDSY